MNNNYDFFYDMSYEDYENEDDNLMLLYDKQYRKYSRAHKLYVMKLNKLQEDIKQIEKNVQRLNTL